MARALDLISQITATVEPNSGAIAQTPGAFIARIAKTYPGFGKMFVQHQTSLIDRYTIMNSISLHGVNVVVTYSSTSSEATIAVMHTVPNCYPTIELACVHKRGGPAQAWLALQDAVKHARDVTSLIEAGSTSTIHNLVVRTAGGSRSAQYRVRRVITDSSVLKQLDHFLS